MCSGGSFIFLGTQFSKAAGLKAARTGRKHSLSRLLGLIVGETTLTFIP